MSWILKNWKTSLAGVGAMLAALGLFGKAINDALAGSFSWQEFLAAWTALSASFGLFAAKDGNVSNAPSPAAPATVPPGT